MDQETKRARTEVVTLTKCVRDETRLRAKLRELIAIGDEAQKASEVYQTDPRVMTDRALKSYAGEQIKRVLSDDDVPANEEPVVAEKVKRVTFLTGDPMDHMTIQNASRRGMTKKEYMATLTQEQKNHIYAYGFRFLMNVLAERRKATGKHETEDFYYEMVQDLWEDECDWLCNDGK